jgi:hypothetical protein
VWYILLAVMIEILQNHVSDGLHVTPLSKNYMVNLLRMLKDSNAMIIAKIIVVRLWNEISKLQMRRLKGNIGGIFVADTLNC